MNTNTPFSPTQPHGWSAAAARPEADVRARAQGPPRPVLNQSARRQPASCTARPVGLIMRSMQGMLVACATLSVLGGQLAPYQGIVAGVVSLTFVPPTSPDLPPVFTVESKPPASEVSSHLGKGVQVFETLNFYPTETGLYCEGVGYSVAANGDVLQLEFTLDGSFSEDMSYVDYTGTYTILPGGTGRFVYEFAYEHPGFDLGTGTLEGMALVRWGQPTDSGIPFRLLFSHRFTGDIYLTGRPRK